MQSGLPALYGWRMSASAQSGSLGVCVALLEWPNRLKVKPELSTTYRLGLSGFGKIKTGACVADYASAWPSFTVVSFHLSGS